MMPRTFTCLRVVLVFLVLLRGLSAQSVILSELLALNKTTLSDSDGDATDWLEIQNVEGHPLSLDGWFLTDDLNNLRKWRFPEVIVEPEGFLVVFASGKNRANVGGELHTNFKLSAPGEFLALVQPDGSTVAHHYAGFPQQRVDVSYGVSSDGTAAFFAEPTPGRKNSPGFAAILAAPGFSHSRGFHQSPFLLELATNIAGTRILYTLDGSDPNDENGQTYDQPIPVKTTTVVRARAFKDQLLPSASATHTYLFLQDVAKQGSTPPGYPGTWKGKKAVFPADYEMDPDITGHPRYEDVLDDALLAVPSICLATDAANLFDPERGIYQNPKGHGMAWERPVSVEWLLPDGRDGFQVNAGVRIQGNGSRTPKKSPKHSFRLMFRKIYGPGRLRFPIFDDGRAAEDFDTLILRAEYNQSWIHANNQRERAQFVRDQWMKDTQRAMGHPSPHATYAHLYINGLYWGLYSPNERATAEFAAAYEGGEREAYDATNSGRAIDGTIDAYQAVFRLAQEDTTTDSVYKELGGIVDIPSFIDYMILNQYAGNRDRDSHNWYSIQHRTRGGLQYVSWDAESVFIEAEDDRLSLNEPDSPSGLFRRLIRNRHFASQFADHVQRHFFGNGLLTPSRGGARWERRARQVFDAVVAESARWGDYRRDVDPKVEFPAPLLERDVHWVAERKRVLEEVLPQRAAIVLQQYRGQGYYPGVDAPRLSQDGGTIPETFELAVSAPRGRLYYTIDGSDPRGTDNKPAASAQPAEPSGEKILLTGPTRVKSRAFVDGEWSALTEGFFTRSGGLRVSEILFHAAADAGTRASDLDDLEFIEFTNVSPHTLDLTGVRLTRAVEFAFAAGTSLAAGEVAVVVADTAAFKKRHGAEKVRILGEYQGKLSNAGEEMVILGSMGETILRFTYRDHWFPEADGRGSSLVVVDLTDDPDTWSLRDSWRTSETRGGSPGVLETPSGARKGPGEAD